MPDTNPEPWGETKIVGKPIPKIDAFERLSGKAIYTLDVELPEMLHAATLRCPHGNAMVQKVDFAEARRMPGVRAILSNADPEANISWYGMQAGRPVSRLFDPHCRHEGEEVAVVAAETLNQAWDAVRAIQVQYQTLPSVTNMEDARKPAAPKVHESGNLANQPSQINRGDVDKGFAEADAVLEETYRTPCEIHTPLESFGSVAKW